MTRSANETGTRLARSAAMSHNGFCAKRRRMALDIVAVDDALAVGNVSMVRLGSMAKDQGVGELFPSTFYPFGSRTPPPCYHCSL